MTKKEKKKLLDDMTTDKTQPNEADVKEAENTVLKWLKETSIDETTIQLKMAHSVTPKLIAHISSALHQSAERARAETDAKWIALLKDHRKHCTQAGNRHLTQVKMEILWQRKQLVKK
jgi:hypothetical protein